VRDEEIRVAEINERHVATGDTGTVSTEGLEGVWRSGAITRAVLVDGSANGAPVRRGRGRPRIRPVDEERRAILDAARTSFAELGFHGATIDGIARRAGIDRRSVYRQFADKDQLFAAMMDDAVGDLLRHMATAIGEAEGLDLEDHLRHVYRRVLGFATSDPAWGALVLSSMTTGSDIANDAALRARRRLEHGIELSARHRWQTLGLPELEYAAEVASMIVGLGITMGGRILQEPTWDVERTAAVMATFTTAGIHQLEARARG